MSYDPALYKAWTWKHPFVLHFILNPGLAFNELVLGQRVPKLMLVEKNNPLSLVEKSYIPCPHCHTLHSSMKWSTQNKTVFGNWYGLYCDHCGGIIPCVRNLTSYLFLFISFPFWYFTREKRKQQWLVKQQEKFAKPLSLTPPLEVWWQSGLSFAFFLFVANLLLYWYEEGSITGKQVLSECISSIIAGLFFGLFMKGILPRKKNTKEQVSA